MPGNPTSLAEALEWVQSEKASNRKAGLTEMKRLLKINQSSAAISKVKDDSFHTLFEGLFRTVTREKAALSKSSRSKPFEIDSRLVSCADAVRHAIEAALPRLRLKSLTALVGHFLQVLPSVDGSFFEPLSDPYLKCLTLLFSYAPHVEHLPHSSWLELIDLLLGGLRTFTNNVGAPHAPLQNSFHTAPHESLSSNTRFSQSRVARYDGSSKRTSTVFQCLKHLVSSPGHRLLDRAEDVINATIAYLASPASTFDTLDVFTVLTLCLQALSFENITKMKQTLKSILHLLPPRWRQKSPELRDEILRLYVILEPHIVKFATTYLAEDDVESLETLYEAISDDYLHSETRLHRNHLDLEDLRLGVIFRSAKSSQPIQSRSISITRPGIAPEHNWTTIHFISSLLWSLDKMQQRSPVEESSQSPHHVRKRRKKGAKLEDVLKCAANKSESNSSRSRCLQVLTVYAETRSLPEDTVNDIVEKMLPMTSDSLPHVSSWALMTIAGCATQDSSDSQSLRGKWEIVWDMCLKSASGAAQSRPACHVLCTLLSYRLVEPAQVSRCIDLMTSSESLNQPALVCDSSIGFWLLCYQTLNASQAGGSALLMHQEIISWITNKWSPSNFENRTYAAQASRVLPVHALLRAILSPIQSLSSQIPSLARLNIIGQAWLQQHHNYELAQYLLLNEVATKESFGESNMFRQQESSTNVLSSDSKNILISMLSSEIDKIIDLWQAEYGPDGRKVSPESFQLVFSLQIVVDSIVHHPSTKSITGLRFGNRIGALRKLLTENLLLDSGTTLKEDLAETLISLLPFRSSSLGEPFEDERFCLSRDTVEQVSLVIQQHDKSSKLSEEDELEMDLDDVETDNHNPSSQLLNSTSGAVSRLGRDEDFSSSVITFLSRARTYITLFSSIIASKTHDPEGDALQVPRYFTDYLLQVPALDLLASRSLLALLHDAGYHPSNDDTERLLVHLGESFMRAYEFRQHETLLLLVIQALEISVHLWTDRRNPSIFDIGSQIYTWLTKLLDAGVCSSAVEMKFSDLLFAVIGINNEYKANSEIPSMRTIALDLLKNGEIRVQFHIAYHLPKIFSIFVTGEHDKIFEDVQKSTSMDRDWTEGMAIRLMVLALLASSWSTLRRRCVYHIFEVAALIPEVVPYVTWCIRLLSNKMGLESPVQVFATFRSQILYTWLSEHNLESIPWLVFGIDHPRDLDEDSKRELLAQIMLRGPMDRVKELERVLQVPLRDLVIAYFDQTAAYCILRDVSPLSTDSRISHVGENLLIDVLGKKDFTNLLTKHCATIAGHMLMRLDGEETTGRTFERREYVGAASIYESFKDKNGSEEPLPPAQQPSFRVRYVLDGIERLCRRISLDPSALWTHFSITCSLRLLLNDLQPALGFFHTRRTMRRMRVLLSLSGDKILSGYPLELVIHGLRPFLNDNLCAQDTMIILKYMLHGGREYLREKPSFVAGTLLSVFINMRRLLDSTQDSTTQGSQHLAMLSEAEAFRSWLKSFLHDYGTPMGPSSFNKRFQILMHTATAITGTGSSSTNSLYEPELLQVLLDDMISRTKVLAPRVSESCLRQLCERFQPAESYRDNIAGTDNAASKIASSVWSSVRFSPLDENYLLWAAGVLGRAFRYEGSLPVESMYATSLRSRRRQSNSTSVDSSRSSIISYLVDQLSSEDHFEVAICELSLQQILDVKSNDEETIQGERLIPDSVRVALKPATGLAPWNFRVSQVPAMSLSDAFAGHQHLSLEAWTRNISVSLSERGNPESILYLISPALRYGKGILSSELFPQIIHSALAEANGSNGLKQRISDPIAEYFNAASSSDPTRVRLFVNTVIYLLNQPYPGETTYLDRAQWLDLDLAVIAEAATSCRAVKSALYLSELAETLNLHSNSRNHKGGINVTNQSLLLIFRDIEEPDAYHGVVRSPNLTSVGDRLAFEGSSSQELLIRSAQADSVLRMKHDKQHGAFNGVLNSLSRLSMNSITFNLGLRQQSIIDASSVTSMVKSAMRLRRWDLSIPTTNDDNLQSMYETYRAVNECSELGKISLHLHKGSLRVLESVRRPQTSIYALKTSFASLAAFTEAVEMFSSRDESDLKDLSLRSRLGCGWADSARHDDLEIILTSREALSGMISDSATLQKLLGVSRQAALLEEVKIHLKSSQILRASGLVQQAVNNVAYLSELAPLCQEAGLAVDATVKQEAANVLWESGELITSIHILRDLADLHHLETQVLPVGKAGLLATLGHRISEARMEKPDEILNKYLAKAQKALGRKGQGDEAGRVFHEYAAYCHGQLVNQEFVTELQRADYFKDKRTAEIAELDGLLKSSLPDDQKIRAKSDRNKARKWLEIDRVEYERLNKNKEQFLRQSLENYILALVASDEHDTDVLRFVALWLENAAEGIASDTVSKYSGQVPTHKLAPLMSQLASRLQDENDEFQRTMARLVEQICTDHPHHGMYHIYAGINTKGGNDLSAKSRNAAAKKIASRLHNRNDTSSVWAKIHKANEMYTKLAYARSDSFKAGARIALRKVSASKYIERDVPGLSVPPITLSVPLRPDGNYATVPVVSSFKPEMSIASGLSAPKVITAYASNGVQCKQLFKAGSDDLRQDAIMEQVFGVVSSLLRNNRETRKRELRIRTYNVIPLDATSGAIEFVQNTTPLTDFLRPAHQRYYPKDLKWDVCRAKVDEARQRSVETRIKVYKDVAERFHPVLRHFFFERFKNPEDWFDRRLAYTRSTATISILGHALGLGDRHCQNILLDTVTGECVHIDLGVAFEAGRILAVPEVVPFRLTRDIVDGMGIMGVEGVFRRCCEFTLEALRNNRDAVMTLLNVLRYDPLYSWSMSPLRARRLQEEQAEIDASAQVDGKATRAGAGDRLLTRQRSRPEGSNELDRDGGEADRALSVVEKKLAPGLSVMATVNELIQQATNERNLAVLFCGWAAYA